MKRPWQVWTVFGICLAVAATGLAWLSYRVAELERAEAQRNLQADFEGNVRLALRRIDLHVSQLLAEQNAWPYLAYEDAYRPPSVDNHPSRAVPSPLGTPSPPVKLYFQLSSGSGLRSPGVPARVGPGSIDQQGNEGRAPGLWRDQLARNRRSLSQLGRVLDGPRLLAQLPPPKPLATEEVARSTLALASDIPAPSLPEGTSKAPPAPVQAQQNASPEQQVRNGREWAIRVKGFQDQITNQAAQIQRRDQYNQSSYLPQGSGLESAPNAVRGAQVLEGLIQPVWLGGELLLARQVKVDDHIVLQGCWIDWPALKQELASEVADLLPSVDLVPVADEQAADPGRLLATLKAQLLVAPPSFVGLSTSPMSPVRLALLAAWIGLSLAALAAALLLGGVLVLSERRAAFVSAVTHELRTPLTTFRMYSEMLSEGMVPEESQRRHYLRTLKTEADRLFHLIENVLCYARLERSRHATSRTAVTVEQLLSPIVERLSDRAARDNMQIEFHLDESASGESLLTDPTAVEQIMVNLVDNACKYADGAADGRIHLEVCRDGAALLIRVRDHGPGIAPRDTRRLFRPFTKSAREAAHSAPGIGLGLALSRGLAKDLGGTLRLEAAAGSPKSEGASLLLRLPLAMPSER